MVEVSADSIRNDATINSLNETIEAVSEEPLINDFSVNSVDATPLEIEKAQVKALRYTDNCCVLSKKCEMTRQTSNVKSTRQCNCKRALERSKSELMWNSKKS
jgi:hypothetical protein